MAWEALLLWGTVRVSAGMTAHCYFNTNHELDAQALLLLSLSAKGRRCGDGKSHAPLAGLRYHTVLGSVLLTLLPCLLL